MIDVHPVQRRDAHVARAPVEAVGSVGRRRQMRVDRGSA
jgi:hypothetical protein